MPSLTRVPTAFVVLLLAALPAAPALSGIEGQTQEDTLLVLNKEEATLVIVDPSSGRVLGRVATGEGPHEMVVSADASTAFVGNYGAQTPGSTISVIDLASRKESRRVDLGPLRRPHGMAVADSKVYFTAETNRLVARYDPASNQVDWLLGTGQAGTHMVWVSADATMIVTTNIGSDSISILERGANPLAWNVTLVPVGRGPEGFDVSADGRQLWTAHSRDGGVSVVDLPSKKVVETIDVGTKRSNRLKLTRDGRLALISDLDGGELIVVDVPARKVSKRLALGKMPEGILLAPDGSRAFVAVNGDDHVAVVELKTLSVTSKIATGDGPDGMAWVRRAH